MRSGRKCEAGSFQSAATRCAASRSRRSSSPRNPIYILHHRRSWALYKRRGGLVDRISCYTPKHAKVVKGVLEPGLLFQRPLVIETCLDEDPVGGIVTRQGPSFHAAQFKMTVCTSDNCADRFGHETSTPKFPVRIAPDLTPSPSFMAPIDTHLSNRPTVPAIPHP